MDDVPGALEAVEVHHRVQGSLIDLLGQLVTGGSERALAEETLTRLVDFTLAHFHTEERLMRQLGYPRAGAHAAEHVRLMSDIRAIQAGHAAGDPGGAERMAELRRWLLEHIQGMDGAFLDWHAAQTHPDDEGR